MTKEEIIEECKQRLGFETDYEMYSLCQHEKDFLKAIIKALEQQPSEDCVSRAEVIKLYDEYRPRLATHVSEFGYKLKALPPVTPTKCIATVQFSKEDLREICNERIEIECTHGTCKDCENWDKECHYCFMLDCDTGKDFYCKGFEKRGDSDDSN